MTPAPEHPVATPSPAGTPLPRAAASRRRTLAGRAVLALVLVAVSGTLAVGAATSYPHSSRDPSAGRRVWSGPVTFLPAPAEAPAAEPPVAPISHRLLGALRAGTLIPRAKSVADDVITAAVRHQVDPLLLHAIILVESGYRNDAVSPAGARGLMQIMPDTGAQLGVHSEHALHVPSRNVDAGARYLRWLNGRFDGQLPLVVAAYNAGPGAVQKHGGKVPPYPETRAYVDDVMWLYGELTLARDRRKPD